MKTIILGISAYYHDSAAAIIVDGEIIAAAQEERFTRKKGDASFPHQAINYCLNEAKINIKDVDYVAFYEEPLMKFERLLLSAHLVAPLGIKSFLAAMPKWLTTNIWLENKICKELGYKKGIIFFEHHMSHAASAFFPSPFEKAAILTVDGVGEWATATYGIGEGNKIKLIKEMRFPDSIGLLYSTFTYYTGFKINSGEYKLMGLAPYGNPKYTDLIKKELLTIHNDGSISLNQKYFNYSKGLTMSNKKFNQLFGGNPRKPESKITQKEMDIAASIQEVLNEIMIKLVNNVHRETKCDNLVMAGGVALNVASIGYIKDDSKIKNIWVQPASGDAGGALGVALLTWYHNLENKRLVNPSDDMKGAFLGPDILEKDEKIDEIIKSNGGVFEYLTESKLVDTVSDLIIEGKIIGIARGKMEYGPRALGNRSIIGDARVKDMQQKMNLKIKFRESFRPFAPMVLKEDAQEYFDIKDESPYMLSTYKVLEKRRIVQTSDLFGIDLLNLSRSDIPAVTHIDYSARVQTVDQNRHPFMHQVLTKIKEKSGFSVNVKGEPIVNTPMEAFICFMNTDIDYLVLGNRLFEKEKQDKKLYLSKNKKGGYKLD